MNVGWQRRLRYVARASGWAAGSVVIAMAVLMALAQLLLPLVARHPQWVAAELSARLAQPVRFASMEGRWTRLGPLLVLRDVTVGAADPAAPPLHIPEVALGLDFGGWLRPSRHLLNARVRGLRLAVQRAPDGRWSVNGTPLGGTGRVDLGHLSLDLWLDEARLTVDDARAGRTDALLVPRLRVSRSSGGRVRAAGIVRRADVAGTLRVVADVRDDGKRGRLWLGLDAAALPPLLGDRDVAGYRLEHGGGKLAAWFAWRDGDLHSVLLQADLTGLAVTAGGRSAHGVALRGLAGASRDEAGWRVTWAGDDGGALAAEVRGFDTPALAAGVALRHLRLAPWLPLVKLAPDVAPALAAWLGDGNADATVTGAQLRWSRAAGLGAVDLGFSDLAVKPSESLPGLSSLRGELRGDAEALALSLPVQASTLTVPGVFRAPLAFTGLSGTLALWRQDGDWTLGLDALDVAGDGYAAQVRGQIAVPAHGGAPRMDVYARVDHAAVQAVKQFWPVNAIPPATVAWLDRALVAGDVHDAAVVLHGDMAEWPFPAHEGRFEAHAPVRGVTLAYAPGWPRADDIEATADFVNSGMRVVASRGQSLGLRADLAVAEIGDFATSPLELTVRGGGGAGDALRFVRDSPIGSGARDALDKLTVRGKATFAMHLALPLAGDAGAVLQGGGELGDVSADAPDWNLHLGQVAGPLQFDIDGFTAGPLQAEFNGRPAVLALAIGDVPGHADTTVWAQLDGRYALADLLQDYPSLGWIGQAASGDSPFHINFSAMRATAAKPATERVAVDSDLQGIALALPAPLDKPADAALPLHLTLGIPVDGGDLQLALGQVARARFRLADATRPLAGTLSFGHAMPSAVPQQGLQIDGHADALDVTGWVAQVAGDGGSGALPLQGVNVTAKRASWFTRSLGAMDIQAAMKAGTLAVNVDGASLAGTIDIPTADLKRLGVTARIQRLYWPGAKPDAAAPAPGAAGAAEAETTAGSATPAADPANTGVDPSALPPFHLWVKDLRLGVARLGEARLESWPTAHGMRIEQLRSLSSDVQITASGDWNGTATNSHSTMNVNFSANDLGNMLGAFGFAGLVHGGKTHDELAATWPGAPSSFELANMDGTLSVAVQDGRIPEAASPGVGRLLGLVSLTELPRRLTFDFGDVFGKGLAFDSISGHFRLANGDATTSDLAINGPSANITISGRTGLRARDYDQEVHVVPHVGNSLPLVGAVVGGPVGAAAGLAMQGLLGHGLNMAASARYRITGSWDKPVMTLIEKQGGRAPAAGATAPAAASSVN